MAALFSPEVTVRDSLRAQWTPLELICFPELLGVWHHLTDYWDLRAESLEQLYIREVRLGAESRRGRKSPRSWGPPGLSGERGRDHKEHGDADGP